MKWSAANRRGRRTQLNSNMQHIRRTTKQADSLKSPLYDGAGQIHRRLIRLLRRLFVTDCSQKPTALTAI